MGHNDMQRLAEAICLHMLPLILLASIMGGPNELHSVMGEVENTMNCPQDPKKGRSTIGKMMDEETDNQARQTSLCMHLDLF